MSTIDPTAALGFARAAGDYERGRPGYAPAAVELIVRELGIGRGSRVVDLGAGTGKLTRALTGFGAELLAIEPLAEMREQLRTAVPDGVRVLDGTAERTGLESESVDAVVVAQAFHWFDAPAAAAEIHRVLRPGGGLAVIRNERDTTPAWSAELIELIEERTVGTGITRHVSAAWREELASGGLFAPLSEREFAHDDIGDLEALVARIASISYVSAQPSARRASLLEEVRALARRHGLGVDGGAFATPYRTRVLWTRRLDAGG